MPHQPDSLEEFEEERKGVLSLCDGLRCGSPLMQIVKPLPHLAVCALRYVQTTGKIEEGFRLSESEARIIKAAARKKGLRLSEFIREAILLYAKKSK